MRKILFVLSLLLLSGTIEAQTKVVPIVDLKIRGLLGGVENGKFLDAKTTVQKLAAEQNYKLFLPDGTNGNLLLKKPTNGQDVCDDFYNLEMDAGSEAEKRFEKGGIGLGLGYGWKPQPRSLKSIDLNNPEYKKIVNDFLRSKGITLPVARLSQAIRADLDGDGQEEVLLSATRVVDYEKKKARTAYDEYSVVLLRKIINGKPQNILLGGEFVPKSRGVYDGYQYSVSSVADLNGDGRMEIILYSAYYEGSDVQVFEMKRNKPVEVETLRVGCGI
ncbi:MAG TPA: VCBS repeat-containing protein [Pyrinomonadaceae bacterium]|jgi:hypothetical protein